MYMTSTGRTLARGRNYFKRNLHAQDVAIKAISKKFLLQTSAVAVLVLIYVASCSDRSVDTILAPHTHQFVGTSFA